MVKTYRKRYLLFQVNSEVPRLEGRDVLRAVKDAVNLLFGSFGLSQANLSMVLYDEDEHLGVLRCSHKFLDAVRAALVFVTNISGGKVSLGVVRVSGTLRSLKRLPA